MDNPDFIDRSTATSNAEPTHRTLPLRRALIYLWAGLTTAVGLGVMILASVSSRVRVEIVDGVVEVSGGRVTWFLQHATPLPGGARAMTLGHVVLGVSAHALLVTRSHERVHVRQCERWGPLFIPAYLLTSLLLAMRGKDAYRDNFFEREAFGKAP